MGFFNKKGHYRHYIYCPNCKRNMRVEIKKGTTADNYCKERDCPRCGCKPIQSGEKEETYY